MIHRIIDSKQGDCANGALSIVITAPGVSECCNLWSHEDFDPNDLVETAKMSVDQVKQKLRQISRCLSAGSLNVPVADLKRPATTPLSQDAVRHKASQ